MAVPSRKVLAHDAVLKALSDTQLMLLDLQRRVGPLDLLFLMQSPQHGRAPQPLITSSFGSVDITARSLTPCEFSGYDRNGCPKSCAGQA